MYNNKENDKIEIKRSTEIKTIKKFKEHQKDAPKIYTLLQVYFFQL